MARKNEQDSQEVAVEETEAPAPAPAASVAPAPAIDPAAFAALVTKVEALEKQVQSLTLRLRHTI